MTGGRRRCVLVLDRNDGVRSEISRLFENEYEVTSFKSTDEAVAALQSGHEYALAVCEFVPDDPGAATLVRLVGERQKVGRLRCAMTLTGAQCEEVGECVCAVLAKPFTRNALLRALALEPISSVATNRRER